MKRPRSLSSKKPAPDRAAQRRVQALYCVEGRTPQAIERATGVPAATILAWADRLGWRPPERAPRKRALLEKGAGDEAGTLAAVAQRAGKLVERGFDLVEQAAEEGDARAFATAVKGVEALHALWRQARGLDRPAAEAAPAPHSAAFVCMRFGESHSQPVVVNVQAETAGSDGPPGGPEAPAESSPP